MTETEQTPGNASLNAHLLFSAGLYQAPKRLNGKCKLRMKMEQ